jgi:hypothetical protein
VTPAKPRADASLPTEQNGALKTVATSSSFIAKNAHSTRISSSSKSRTTARAGVVRHIRAIASIRIPASSAFRPRPASVTRIVDQPSPPVCGSRASSSANAIARACWGSRSRTNAASSPPSRTPGGRIVASSVHIAT